MGGGEDASTVGSTNPNATLDLSSSDGERYVRSGAGISARIHSHRSDIRRRHRRRRHSRRMSSSRRRRQWGWEVIEAGGSREDTKRRSHRACPDHYHRRHRHHNATNSPPSPPVVMTIASLSCSMRYSSNARANSRQPLDTQTSMIPFRPSPPLPPPPTFQRRRGVRGVGQRTSGRGNNDGKANQYTVTFDLRSQCAALSSRLLRSSSLPPVVVISLLFE